MKGLIDFLRTLISTLDKNAESRVILIKYWLGLNQTIMVYNPTMEGIPISVLFLKSKVCVNLYSHLLLYKTILYTIETGVQIIVHNQLGLPDMPKPSRHSLPVNWADHVTWDPRPCRGCSCHNCYMCGCWHLTCEKADAGWKGEHRKLLDSSFKIFQQIIILN